MERGLWIARKNYLCTLVKKTGLAAGDDLAFIRDHCRDLIARYADASIEIAIQCYERMAKENEKIHTTIPGNLGALQPCLRPPFAPWTKELEEAFDAAQNTVREQGATGASALAKASPNCS